MIVLARDKAKNVRQTDSSWDGDVADRRKQPGTSSYNTNQSNQNGISICRPSIGRQGAACSGDAWPGMSVLLEERCAR